MRNKPDFSWTKIVGRGVVLGAALSGACTGERSDGVKTGDEQTFAYSVRDTLNSRTGYAIGRPLWISQDPTAAYVIADESDKALKRFTAAGTEAAPVGRPGSGPGEFTALLGGGALGDSLYAYDFNGTRLTVFSPAGAYVRSFSVAQPGTPMPSSVRVIDDSLVLVAGFPVGSHTRDLIRLLRRDGSTRSTFFNHKAYFSPEDPALIQSSVVHADGTQGVVFAGMMGHDSVYAFSYDGRRLGAGPLLREGGEPVRTFRSVLQANGGRRTRPDGAPAIQGETELVAITAMDGRHAVAQLMTLNYGPDGQLDRTEGGTFVLLSLDPAAGTVSATRHTELKGGLFGRDRQGNALLARYLGADYEQMEIAQLRLAPGPGGGGS